MMTKLSVAFAALATVVLAAMPAEARPYDQSAINNPAPSLTETMNARPGRTGVPVRSNRMYRAEPTYHASASAGVGRRPGKWCGWWMRTQKGGGPEYNVAWNWRNYGSPTTPQVGAVVVWRHHVGMITGQASNGMWIVKSGNDGGRVRERARSVSGAVFRI